MTVLAAEKPVQVVYLPSPFVRDRRFVEVPDGPTLAEIAAGTRVPPEQLRLVLDGQAVPQERWETTTPGPGAHVLIGRRPAGAAFAHVLAQFVGNALSWAATNLAGTAYVLSPYTGMLVNRPHLGETEGSGVRRTIRGDRNALPQYDPVPQVLGRHKFVPPLAAATFTTEEDGKLFQHSLYTFGPGTLALEDLRIGEDPVFKDGTTLVYTGKMEADGVVAKTKFELRQGTGSDAAITLYSKDVQETIFAERLRHDRAVIHRTVARTVRIVVLIGFPNGLTWLRDTGGTKPRTVRVRVEHRSATSTGSWTDDGVMVVEEETRSSVYRAREIDVSEGTYDVRVTRLTEEGQDAGIVDETYWTSMHQHRAGTVVAQTGLCLVAMRRQITNNASGLTEDFSAIAQTVCLDWNGSTWAAAATSNPASLFRHVLQGTSNRRPVADSRIDLEALAAWHEDCDANGFEFNYVTNGRTTVREVLRMIAAAGRASFAMQDGKYTVVRDGALTGSPVQLFTPRNVRSFAGRRFFERKPDAWRCSFVSPEEDWLQTERIVPDDGFTEDTAEEFESLSFPGVTDSDQAYALGRYHIAQRRLRPEEYVIETDFEHLDCVRGDWVRLSHDAPLVGLHQGRVLAVAVDGGGNATGVTVDQECTMAADTYGMVFRRSADGGFVEATVVTAAGAQTVLTFVAPISSATKPAVGDLFAFGRRTQETIECRVKSIEPGPDHAARLVLVDAAPECITAAEGAIPAYKPRVTIPPRRIDVTIAKKRERVRVISIESASTKGYADVASGKGALRVRLQPKGSEVRT